MSELVLNYNQSNTT